MLELRNKDIWYLRPLARASGRHAIVHGSGAMATTARPIAPSVAPGLGGIRSLERAGRLRLRKSRKYVPRACAGPACFQASELGHRLLPPASCVTNEIELNRDSPFYIVSGSNMSGKSTLLRAIGLNAVLAFAGAPVRARALRLSGLSIFASLSIVDSLLNGKSKFLAEVDRLRQAIESAVPDRPVLFLVDEIFSGTNSRDRRIAAEAVVRTLVNRGAIGALSTHDLALTEMAGGARRQRTHGIARSRRSNGFRLPPQARSHHRDQRPSHRPNGGCAGLSHGRHTNRQVALGCPIFKTRSLASRACEMGRVESNGQHIKPSREVRVGDLLQVKNDSGEFQIEVLA